MLPSEPVVAVPIVTGSSLDGALPFTAAVVTFEPDASCVDWLMARVIGAPPGTGIVRAGDPRWCALRRTVTLRRTPRPSAHRPGEPRQDQRMRTPWRRSSA